MYPLQIPIRTVIIPRHVYYPRGILSPVQISLERAHSVIVFIASSQYTQGLPRPSGKADPTKPPKNGNRAE